jgi:acetate CoA/acetoacetate CoA-transferase beta subunit
MKSRLDRDTIALRVAKEFFDGAVVNLGGGIPTLACNFVPEGRTVTFHSENGMLGFGPVEYDEDKQSVYRMNASGQFVQSRPGISFFDHATSFAMIRGGHVDISVLGAFQVSEKGDLANWMIPERGIGVIGGAMDLAFSCKKLIVAMEHTTPKGGIKIYKKCTYPLTAPEVVDLIITDLAVIEITKAGLLLKEIAPGWTVAEVQAVTEPKLIVAKDLTEITL